MAWQACSRRKFLSGTGAAGLVSLVPSTVRSDVSASGLQTECLPDFLAMESGSAPTPSFESLADEIQRERNRQPIYYEDLEDILTPLSLAANRLCEALQLQDAQRPEILFATQNTWRTVQRTTVSGANEVILLSATHSAAAAADDPSVHMLFAILAHEFGHVYQYCQMFDYGNFAFVELYLNSGSQRDIELHADYIGGFGLARIESRYGDSEGTALRRFSDTVFALGKYDFRRCDHHGTPAERYYDDAGLHRRPEITCTDRR